MIDYIPLGITFLLAIVGLLLKTTQDPEGASLRKRLTGGGLAVLVLLSISLMIGVALTVKRKQADHESARRAAARYERDSTTASASLRTANTELLVQQGAIREARFVAATQLHRLDSTLTVSSVLARDLRDLGDSLRAQRTALSHEFERQQQIVRLEAEKLRNPLTSPRVRLDFVFPPIDEAKAYALSSVNADSRLSDSARARMRAAITDSR